MSKKNKIQAYVKDSTKAFVVKQAEEQELSESHVAGKLLDEAIKSKEVKN